MPPIKVRVVDFGWSLGYYLPTNEKNRHFINFYRHLVSVMPVKYVTVILNEIESLAKTNLFLSKTPTFGYKGGGARYEIFLGHIVLTPLFPSYLRKWFLLVLF